MPQHQPQSPYTTASHLDYAPRGRKRSREYELRLDLQGLHGLSGDEGPGEVPVSLTPHGYHSHGASMHYQTAPGPPPHHLPLPPPPQQHHHHRLPNQAPPHKLHRGSYGEPSPPLTSHGPPSVVGQEGMPAPAPRPRGPKLKFTPEDDQLLVDLKEKKNLTWKQIAEFFPGRSSGTLQVRYCTKLKAKTTVWTDEMVQKLRNAIQEYENDKWRIISAKVGSGFSPAACRDKVAELSGEAILPDDAEDVSFSHAEMIPSSSSDPGVPFQ
ncbi:uncharacterized protein K452DRAFT_325329 [Aplosporella prunicola CBS 121167]|uniref:Myb-like domain-containing protein n=1 Tax=Aplosporella prunicola CBS 121167 TaxID=1176127 RepID=A0A6A6BMH1_9PEZI|nr:uncharacterized protein K452DRAFT_325329 [Aplosporella prunicola CBS 121167]KAF2144037.1 hypothetical protein K452DRAFT_325329 [Aplosporella prunicola CBS 121167]